LPIGVAAAVVKIESCHLLSLNLVSWSCWG
jgi:hypothetical protein